MTDKYRIWGRYGPHDGYSLTVQAPVMQPERDTQANGFRRSVTLGHGRLPCTPSRHGQETRLTLVMVPFQTTS